MTRAAVDTIQSIAACDERGIARRSLLRRERGAPATSAPLRRGRACLRRRLNRDDEHEQSGGGREADGRTHRETSALGDQAVRLVPTATVFSLKASRITSVIPQVENAIHALALGRTGRFRVPGVAHGVPRRGSVVLNQDDRDQPPANRRVEVAFRDRWSNHARHVQPTSRRTPAEPPMSRVIAPGMPRRPCRPGNLACPVPSEPSSRRERCPWPSRPPYLQMTGSEHRQACVDGLCVSDTAASQSMVAGGGAM